MDSIPEHNPRVADRDYKYYIFDWDDNILRMPTRIHLEQRGADGVWREIKVSTSRFAELRNDTQNIRPPGGDWEQAFQEFRDLGRLEDNAFLRDTRTALEPVIRGEQPAAPSYSQFKKALIDGRIFAIVTARGHGPDIIRKGVEYVIDQILTPDERAKMIRNLRGYMHAFDEEHETYSDQEVLQRYLDLNKYHGVTSPAFKALMKSEGASGAENPEAAKQFAIHDFVHHVLELVKGRGFSKPVSIGFSDDDPGNIRAVESYIRALLGKKFPGIKFVVYDTSDPEIKAGRKVIVSGQLDLGLDV